MSNLLRARDADFWLERQAGHALILIVNGVLSAAGLLVPLRGVRDAIAAAKDAELDAVRDALRVARDGAPGARSLAGRRAGRAPTLR